MAELIIGTMIAAVLIAIIRYRIVKQKGKDGDIEASAKEDDTDLPLPPKPPTGTP